jgi:hypothetical protein
LETVDDEGCGSAMPSPVVAEGDEQDSGATSVGTASVAPDGAVSGPGDVSEVLADVDGDVSIPVGSGAPVSLEAGGADAEEAMPSELPVENMPGDGASDETASDTPSGVVGTDGQREDADLAIAAAPTESVREIPSPENDQVEVVEPTEDSGETEPPALDGPAADAPRTTAKRARGPAKRVPRQYQPVARAPSVPRPSGVTGTNIERRESPLRIDVRAQMEHGFWRISLLPRRDAALPQEVAINQDGIGSLIALQDKWYQDVAPGEVGFLLTRGIEWQATLEDGSVVRWSLSGRELFVLAKHDQLSGFVSIPRLVVGERHVVLCTERLAADVRRAIAAAGAPVPLEFDASLGAPPGWIGLHEVVPRHPVPPSAEGDILDALCPQPEVEIAVAGGIRLERSTWLAGFPPLIRLRGDASRAGEVRIDGKVATISGDGSYVADDWDRLGSHEVWCAGKSVTYAIADGEEAWAPWEAYRWSLGELATPDMPARPAICGALVLPPVENQGKKQGTDARGRRAIVVATSNRLLVGATAGQIYASPIRSDLRARTSTGFPPFEPVWALPADRRTLRRYARNGQALRCGKHSARIVLIGRARSPSAEAGNSTNDIRAWSSAILGTSRKSLQTEPARPEVAALWKEYKDVARTLRRRRRR